MHKAIRAVYWDLAPSRLASAWPYPGTELTAIWPSPVNHDQCFMDAGFHEFSDKDDPWDAEFEAMVTRLVDHLAEYGRPSLEVKIPVRCSSGSPSLIDQVIAPTWDDNFDDAVLRFGSPEQVVLRTCHGHEILWVIPRATTQLDPEGLAELCAQGRRAERRQLEWRHLLAMANFS